MRIFFVFTACIAGLTALLCLPVHLNARASADLSAGFAEVGMRWGLIRIRARFRFYLLAPPRLTAVWLHANGRTTVLRAKRKKRRRKRNPRLLAAALSSVIPKTIRLQIRTGCGDAARSVFVSGALQVLLQSVQAAFLPPAICETTQTAVLPMFQSDGAELRFYGIIRIHPAQIILAYLQNKEK